MEWAQPLPSAFARTMLAYWCAYPLGAAEDSACRQRAEYQDLCQNNLNSDPNIFLWIASHVEKVEIYIQLEALFLVSQTTSWT
jgi:hypothetical protein